MTTTKKSVKSLSFKYRHLIMGHVVLILRLCNTPFKINIIYITGDKGFFLSSSQYHNIIASNILHECIALKSQACDFRTSYRFHSENVLLNYVLTIVCDLDF